MNGYERISAALRGEQPDATPVMLHNFMMAAREAGVTMREFRTNPVVMAKTFGMAVEKYGLDGIMVDVNTATLAGALGVPVEFPGDEPAVCRGALLSELKQVRELAPPDVAKYEGVQAWLEAVRLLKKQYSGQVFVRGNCDQAPFSLASLVRGAENWMLDLMEPENEEDAFRLLDYCYEATTQFLRLMAGTGADMISNGDSSAGTSLISPRMHRKFAHPYEKRVAEFAHALKLPYALHVCGNARAILPELVATGSDALELDFKTESEAAHTAMKDTTTLIGNIDPTGVIAMGTAAEVYTSCRRLIDLFADTPRFILNSGCGLPAMTPEANIRAMMRAARESA